MNRSTDCILTTHMGSLPRPDVLADLLVAQAEGRPVDAARVGTQRFPKRWQNYQARGVRRLNVYGFPAAIGPVRYASLDGAIVGDTQVSEDVVWTRPEAMRDGAAIASKRLWS